MTCDTCGFEFGTDDCTCHGLGITETRYQAMVRHQTPRTRYRYQEQTLRDRRVAGTESWGRVWEVIDTLGDLFVAFCPEEADAKHIVDALNKGTV